MPPLNELLNLEASPLANNVILAFLMIGFLKVAHRLRVSSYLSLVALQLFHPLFSTSDWSWIINTVPSASLLLQMLVFGSDLETNVSGAIQWCVLQVYLGLARFLSVESCVVSAAIGLGDGILAPAVGRKYGRHVYQMPWASPKTIEGSVGVWLGTCFGAFFLMQVMGLPLIPLRVMLTHGGLAAVIEGTAPSYIDNFAVAAVLLLSMNQIHGYLEG